MRDFKTFYVKIASLSQRIYNSDQLKIILALLYQHTDEIEQSQEIAKKTKVCFTRVAN